MTTTEDLDRQRIATVHGGKVHMVKLVRNPWAASVGAERFGRIPRCASARNIVATIDVADGTEITCKRCAAKS